MQLSAALLLLGLTLSGQEDVSLQKLLDALRERNDARHKLIPAFAAQKNAPEAIPALVALLNEEKPKPDDVCLTIQSILQKHPGTQCPLDPLLEVVRRRDWMIQENGCLALFEVLRDETAWKGREQELNAALIPLMVSQRSRVFGPALKCLNKINGKAWGPFPQTWRRYYESTYPGRYLDLHKAVYERLVLIRPATSDAVSFTVNGEDVADEGALIKKLLQLGRYADDKDLLLGIVIQARRTPFKDRDDRPPDVQKTIQVVSRFFPQAKHLKWTYSEASCVDLFRPLDLQDSGPDTTFYQ